MSENKEPVEPVVQDVDRPEDGELSDADLDNVSGGTLSTILKDLHDTRQAIIRNMQ